VFKQCCVINCRGYWTVYTAVIANGEKKWVLKCMQYFVPSEIKGAFVKLFGENGCFKQTFGIHWMDSSTTVKRHHLLQYMVNCNPMDKGYIFRWQSDLVYTIEIVLSICDKHYHMNNRFQQMWAEIKYLWDNALFQIP